jgi:hypothetical protein
MEGVNVNNTPLTFAASIALAVITSVAGGIVVITQPGTLDFQTYLIGEGAFLAGLGLFAGGSAKAEAPPNK